MNSVTKRYNDTREYFLANWKEKLREYRRHCLPLDRHFRSLMASLQPKFKDLRAGVANCDIDTIEAQVRLLETWAMLMEQGKALRQRRGQNRRGVSPMARAMLNDFRAAIDEHKINCQ
jgi:hypothetical protein